MEELGTKAAGSELLTMIVIGELNKPIPEHSPQLIMESRTKGAWNMASTAANRFLCVGRTCIAEPVYEGTVAYHGDEITNLPIIVGVIRVVIVNAQV